VTLNTKGSAALRSHSVDLGELPPPAPRDCFGRDNLIEQVVGLVENLEPIALIGAGGIGKTSIALTVLHHNRIKERFRDNRRFIRCDQFPASRSHLLARLSEVIGAGIENPKDLVPLRPLLSSKEMVIILDNAESILDPKGTNAAEIYSLVNELCQFKTICLCITSRIITVPPRCKRPEIPTLSMEAARDIFYGIYGNGGRSNIIDGLLKRLEFHALSITLLATTASHNAWDHEELAKEWDDQRAQVLQTDYNESLAATIEHSLTSPTFRSLGPNARDLLGVVAFFPQGIDEKNLDWLFPIIPDRKNIFGKLRVLSLTHRNNGFITMLAPIRDYLSPQDPLSSPLLCTTRDHYFSRLSAGTHPSNPRFKEARWIVLEDVNAEHLLDVFTSLDQTRSDIWDVCCHFVEHLVWHKPRQTIFGSKIEAFPDDHPSKPKFLTRISWLFNQLGNDVEHKRLLTLTLELQRRRGDDVGIGNALRELGNANRSMGLFKEAIRQSKGALSIFERTNDAVRQAICLSYLARVLHDDGQLEAAENAASRAIDLVPEEGNEFTHCDLHRVLGEVHQSLGEKEKAIHHFKTALGIASPFNWHDELFWNHYHLAYLFRDQNELTESNAHITQAKSLAADDPYKLGRTAQIQASVWYWQHRLEEAKLETLQALKFFEGLGALRDVEACRELLQNVERENENSDGQ
jgi:tetratricopeptide (TPR) repeat protein